MSASERGEKGTWKQLAYWTQGGDLDLKATLHSLPANEHDAAELLASLKPGQLHYVPTERGGGTWYIWDGQCHRPDASNRAGRVISEFAHCYGVVISNARQAVSAAVALEMPGAAEDDIAKKVKDRWENSGWAERGKYAAGLKKPAGHKGLLYQLSVLRGVPESYFEDRYPRHLNVGNGIADLQTGQLHPHDPKALMAYCVPHDYDPAAPEPEQFKKLVWRMTGGSQAVYDFVMLALGYTLLGNNERQVIFFLNGPTGTGKSKVLEIVREILGSLARESKIDLITIGRNDRNARAEFSVRGTRMFTITETSAFMNIDEAQLKRLTGESAISMDKHYATEQMRTKVTFTGWIATNRMPSILSFDDALGRRIIVIPGGPEIPPGEQDERLAEKILASEASQILACLIRQCVRYHREGLHMPAEVATETAKYRGEQNTVAMFVTELCRPSPRGYIQMTDARDRYVQWAHQRGIARLRLQEFYDQMSQLPGVDRNDSGGSIRRFYGLEWNKEAVMVLDEQPDDGLPGYTANQYPEGGWGGPQGYVYKDGKWQPPEDGPDHGDIYKTWKGE